MASNDSVGREGEKEGGKDIFWDVGCLIFIGDLTNLVGVLSGVDFWGRNCAKRARSQTQRDARFTPFLPQKSSPLSTPLICETF